MSKESITDNAAEEAPPIARVSIRVSRQGDRGKEGSKHDFLSPETQLANARVFCALRGWTLDEEASWQHRDIDQSGFKKSFEQRPGIMAHLADAKAGLFAHLIFNAVDRHARQLLDGLLLEREFSRAGVVLHYVEGGLAGNNVNDVFLRNLKLLIAQERSEKLSKDISDVMYQRALKGKPPTAIPGWVVRQDNGEGPFAIDETAAAVILRMVELRRTFLGYSSIARTLAAEGHRTLRGSVWVAARVQRHLSEPYIRHMLGEASYAAKGREPLWIPGAFPPLITLEDAAALRQVTAALRPAYSCVRGKSPSTAYMAAGIIYCALCGAHLTPSGVAYMPGCNKSMHSYRCEFALTEPRHANRKRSIISASQVEKALVTLAMYALSKEAMPAKPPPRKASGALTLKGPPLHQKPRTVEDIDAERDRLLAAHLRGSLPAADYDRHAQALLAERARLEEQAAAESAPESRAAALAALAQSEKVDGEARRRVLRLMLLSTVERVEAPIDAPEGEEFTRYELSGKARRCIRVTLRWPLATGERVFLVPLFSEKYKGEWLILPLTELSDNAAEASLESRLCRAGTTVPRLDGESVTG